MNLISIPIVIMLLVKYSHALEDNPFQCSGKEKSQAYLDVAIEMINKAKINSPSSEANNVQCNSLDCSDLKSMGYNESGVYTIYPRNRLLQYKSIKVYCDMETDEGGWTLIQRRGQFGFDKDYFYRDWSSYKNGFGILDKEFWLGNDNIFALTNQNLYSVRIDLKAIDGTESYALYNRFWIDDETNNYTLHVNDYRGDAGDAMKYHNMRQFSTKDRDNDEHSTSHCAENSKGGWWYSDCYQANLNGPNIGGPLPEKTAGIKWKRFRFFNESLEMTEMKIRPLSLKNHEYIIFKSK